MLQANLKLQFAGWKGLLNIEDMTNLQQCVELQFKNMNLIIWEQLEVFWRVTHDEAAGSAAAELAVAAA